MPARDQRDIEVRLADVLAPIILLGYVPTSSVLVQRYSGSLWMVKLRSQTPEVRPKHMRAGDRAGIVFVLQLGSGTNRCSMAMWVTCRPCVVLE